jgi:hypothetical protein
MQDQGIGLAAENRQATTVQLSAVARTPQPRSRAGTLPSRISFVRNVETPSRSSIYRCLVSRPQGKPNSSAGTGRSKKLTPAAERKQENGNRITGSAASGSRITGRIQEDAWPERELTWIW